MKKITILLIAVVACMWTGCRKPVDVSFDTQALTVAAEGGTYTAHLKSNGEWTLGSIAQWLAVTPNSGNGDATLTLVAQANTTGEARTMELIATTKDNTASMTLTQEAQAEVPGEDDMYDIHLDPSLIECDQDGNGYWVMVQTQTAWTISEAPEWTVFSEMEGEGNDSLKLSIDPLIEGDMRECDVVFSNENASAQLHIIQTRVVEPEHFITITPEEFQAECTGGTTTIVLSCDEAWSVVSDFDWVSFDQTEGNGDDEVLVTVAENPTYELRRAEIKFISASNLSAILLINQDAAPNPHFLEVDPLHLDYESEGGDMDVAISCDTEWHIEYEADWLTVSAESGTGEGVVTFTAATNAINEPRQTSVRVISEALQRTMQVYQAPGEEHYWAAVTPDSLFVGIYGGINTFSINSNCTWTLTVPAWITILETEGEGDATIEMMVSNNPSIPRVGNILVRHGLEVLAIVAVVQDGTLNILSTDVEEINFPEEGGIQFFHIYANQDWMIVSNEFWLGFTPTEGSGDTEIMVKAGGLEGSEPREAVVVIKGSTGSSTTLIVHQSR